MASPIILPFNNQPVSTQKGTGTYTCPAGKYARVTVNVRARATASLTAAASLNATTPGTHETNVANESFDIWVGPGDTVSATLSNASGTQAVGSNISLATRTAATTVTVNHNAAAIGIIEAVASCQVSTGAGGSATLTSSGSSSFHFFAQEYNILS
jgi:hypothetical protein